jgi:carbonic anhydrase
MAQGVGNITSGFLGGIPITSVIVRSSANVSSGGRTRMSAIAHGVLLLISVIAIPGLLNMIPLSALAAILIAVGYKLTKPKIFVDKYVKGWAHLIPFVVTIVAILLTDLLIGVGVGIFVAGFFILYANFQSAVSFTQDGNNCLVRFKKDLSFIHKYELKRIFDKIEDNCNVLLDMTKIDFVDLDNAEIINDFIETAPYRGIRVAVKQMKEKTSNIIKTPEYESA